MLHEKLKLISELTQPQFISGFVRLTQSYWLLLSAFSLEGQYLLISECWIAPSVH